MQSTSVWLIVMHEKKNQLTIWVTCMQFYIHHTSVSTHKYTHRIYIRDRIKTRIHTLYTKVSYDTHQMIYTSSGTYPKMCRETKIHWFYLGL